MDVPLIDLLLVSLDWEIDDRNAIVLRKFASRQKVLPSWSVRVNRPSHITEGNAQCWLFTFVLNILANLSMKLEVYAALDF
jgi:hypothetical protein